ncbi:hypothetical protein [Streptomyces sp. SID4985]|nr:hypothetical protein [Streptomyces sp. SID4985]
MTATTTPYAAVGLIPEIIEIQQCDGIATRALASCRPPCSS